MRLMTKAIEQKAQKQYQFGNVWEKQVIVAKFFNPCGAGTWYLMNQDPNEPDYLWGIVKGPFGDVECGSFSLSELSEIKVGFGLGIERDRYFDPIPVKELWEKLQAGKHV